ncbi:hypothetical protein D0Z00_001067 [Geotrichum galactomycetum]|uniref:Uncharacterized protein n=1 Tax=Geotrichum galactomycetum TaxID=27317 RepID=A0ACB6V7Y1_9ASCO|nr:hypothetical protein D0Z00_001067 [Geotrichum candidum]
MPAATPLGPGGPDLDEEHDEVLLDLAAAPHPRHLRAPFGNNDDDDEENEYELLQHTLMALKDEEKALVALIASENKACAHPLLLPSRQQLMEALLRVSDDQLQSGIINYHAQSSGLRQQQQKTHGRAAQFSVRPITDNDAILGMFHSLTFTNAPVSLRKSVNHQLYRFGGAALLNNEDEEEPSTGTALQLLRFSCDALVHTSNYSVAAFDLVIDYPLVVGSDLHPFIESCRAQKDLSRALYGLSTYAELLMKRYTSFTAIVRQFSLAPNDGTWPLGDTIAFAKRQDNGHQLFISWRIVLTPDNQLAEARSELQAFVRAPVSTEPLAKLNDAFLSLVKEQGVINAISTIHNTLYK